MEYTSNDIVLTCGANVIGVSNINRNWKRCCWVPIGILIILVILVMVTRMIRYCDSCVHTSWDTGIRVRWWRGMEEVTSSHGDVTLEGKPSRWWSTSTDVLVRRVISTCARRPQNHRILTPRSSSGYRAIAVSKGFIGTNWKVCRGLFCHDSLGNVEQRRKPNIQNAELDGYQAF